MTGPLALPADQSLAALLSGGALRASAALALAAQIARELRELHAAGEVHGHVGASTILVGSSGARLAPSLAFPGEHAAQSDVEAWGGVLREILTCSGLWREAGARGKGPDSVLPNAASLALRCAARPPARQLTMQQAYNEIRLLSVLARQYGSGESSSEHAANPWPAHDRQVA